MNLERLKKALTALLALGVALLVANASGTLDAQLGFHIPDPVMKWLGIGIACLGFFSKAVFGWVLPGNPTVPVPKAMVADVKAMTAPPVALLLLLLSGLAFGSGCATTKTGPLTGPTTSVPVQIAADCGAPAVRDLATHLLDDVASALIVTGDWHAALAAVAARAQGDVWPAIKCAIEEIAAKADIQLAARARMDSDAVQLTQERHDRAILWLAEHPR